MYFIFILTELRDWLKSLRLHKYTRVLLELTYEEFLDVTEDQLEKKGVTLGARGKILKNIGFIKQRPQKINELIEMLDVSSFALKAVKLICNHFKFKFQLLSCRKIQRI